MSPVHTEARPHPLQTVQELRSGSLLLRGEIG